MGRTSLIRKQQERTAQVKESKGIEYVALGFCSNDYLSILPEIPLDGKVQILEHLVQGGGPAATSAVAASRLGWKAAFLGSIGDDAPGTKILDDFKAEGVDCSGIRIREHSASPIAYCWIEAPTGKRSVAWTRGSLKELRPEEVDMGLVQNARVLHLDGHHTEAAIAAAKMAKQSGTLVNFDAGTVRPGVEELVKLSDILFTSEHFAFQWTGETDPGKALPKLQECGARVTGITLGEKGSAAWVGGKVVFCPAFRIKPVDTTGAGDVFHTGFAVRYLECGDIPESMRFASAVSALKCLKPGGRTGIPSRAETEDFLKKHS